MYTEENKNITKMFLDLDKRILFRCECNFRMRCSTQLSYHTFLLIGFHLLLANKFNSKLSDARFQSYFPWWVQTISNLANYNLKCRKKSLYSFANDFYDFWKCVFLQNFYAKNETKSIILFQIVTSEKSNYFWLMNSF